MEKQELDAWMKKIFHPGLNLQIPVILTPETYAPEYKKLFETAAEVVRRHKEGTLRPPLVHSKVVGDDLYIANTRPGETEVFQYTVIFADGRYGDIGIDPEIQPLEYDIPSSTTMQRSMASMTSWLAGDK
jgi:hypothetical protein